MNDRPDKDDTYDVKAMRALPREQAPPPGLEDRLVSALRERGRIRSADEQPQRVAGEQPRGRFHTVFPLPMPWRSFVRPALAATAMVTAFALGTWFANRGDRDLPVAISGDAADEVLDSLLANDGAPIVYVSPGGPMRDYVRDTGRNADAEYVYVITKVPVHDTTSDPVIETAPRVEGLAGLQRLHTSQYELFCDAEGNVVYVRAKRAGDPGELFAGW